MGGGTSLLNGPYSLNSLGLALQLVYFRLPRSLLLQRDCPWSRGLRAQFSRGHIVLWGAYPPRPQTEQLTWVGIGTLQPRTKYLPDMVTWMEVWVELGWELSHARAWMRNIEIVYRKEAAMCQLCPEGMRVPLQEPVAHCWREWGD